jgi:preprotein translocase subunit SecE
MRWTIATGRRNPTPVCRWFLARRRLDSEGWLNMNPLKFVDEVRQEVAKVTWPTSKEVWVTTLMVLIMVTLLSIFFLAVDQFFSTVVQYVLSLGR